MRGTTGTILVLNTPDGLPEAAGAVEIAPELPLGPVGDALPVILSEFDDAPALTPEPDTTGIVVRLPDASELTMAIAEVEATELRVELNGEPGIGDDVGETDGAPEVGDPGEVPEATMIPVLELAAEGAPDACTLVVTDSEGMTPIDPDAVGTPEAG